MANSMAICVPEEVSVENIIPPILPNIRTEEFKTLMFFDTSTTGLYPEETDFRLKYTRNSADFSEAMSRFISRCGKDDFPPVTEFAFVVVGREVFENSIKKMKRVFSEKEGENKLDTIKVRCGLSHMSECMDPNVTNEEYYRLYKKYGISSPLYNLRAVEKKFSTKCTKASFETNWKALRAWLDKFPKPAVMIAHNGVHHDFKVLYGELLRYNLLEEGLPKGIYFADSLFATMNIEGIFLDQIRNKLYKEAHEGNPWTSIRQEEESIALKKRLQENDFVEYNYGKWKVAVEWKKRFTVETLYRKIIGGDLDFHWSDDDAKAIFQVALAYGHKFLDYIEEAAAPFPF